MTKLTLAILSVLVLGSASGAWAQSASPFQTTTKAPGTTGGVISEKARGTQNLRPRVQEEAPVSYQFPSRFSTIGPSAPSEERGPMCRFRSSDLTS